ncbi:hypothetical protein BOTNAR_0088g00050 [Botryotinia narcissicola]|uniref:Uncharacterized protein n=1 Tax=Botryotinia narcissicola TaxID=278944 RepID=A0A4Z1ISZ7_9HELO|nr:hypothetical protein BOTNAR_0088g00050 [Botryotinia narcissicola]
MGRKNQKQARKFKPKPRRATPGERRARKEAEEKNLQSATAEAATIRTFSGANEIGEEGTRDDDMEMGPRSTVDAASAASNVHFSRPWSCGKKGDGGDDGDGNEEEADREDVGGEEEEMTQSCFGGGDWRDNKDRDDFGDGSGGVTLGGLFGGPAMMV